MTLPPPNREQIRVLLVDCTKMACELLADAIAHDSSITVVGAVTTAAEAYQVLKHESPDIVLLSERLNGELTGGSSAGPSAARRQATALIHNASGFAK